MKKIILLLLIPLFLIASESEEHHEEGENLPPGVTFYEKKTKEFSLKENVIKNFGIDFRIPFKTGDLFKVPSDSIVRSLRKNSIFVFQNNRFKEIDIKIQDVKSNYSFISVAEMVSDSKFVIKGSNFLKTITLFLEEGPAEDH